MVLPFVTGVSGTSARLPDVVIGRVAGGCQERLRTAIS
jgi:hypothetical protein